MFSMPEIYNTYTGKDIYRSGDGDRSKVSLVWRGDRRRHFIQPQTHPDNVGLKEGEEVEGVK